VPAPEVEDRREHGQIGPDRALPDTARLVLASTIAQRPALASKAVGVDVRLREISDDEPIAQVLEKEANAILRASRTLRREQR